MEGKRKRKSPPPRDYAPTKYDQPGDLGCSTLMSNYKAKAKKFGWAFELSFEAFKHLTSQPCSYCGQLPSNLSVSKGNTSAKRKEYGAYRYNGIDRLNSDFGYVEGNVVASCRRCNVAKNDQTEDEFLEQVKRIYERRCM